MIKSSHEKNERIYDLLTQDSYFILNRKLNSYCGLVLGAFIVFLLDKEKYHKYNGELTQDGYFYATDMDIMLMTGLTSSQVSKLKNTAVEKELVFIKREGIPLKTYYKINLQKINDIMNLNKTAMELSYERIIFENKEQKDISNLLNVSEATLSNLTFKDLRFICKKFKVSYSGKNTKLEIVEKILEGKEKILQGGTTTPVIQVNTSTEVSSVQDLKNITFKNLRIMCKKLNISYSGKDTKDVLINKIADFKGFLKEEPKEEDAIVPEIIFNEKDFEELFKEFDISYTYKNQLAVKKLREKMSDSDVYLYLKETYENIKATPEVKNIGALFSSKIAKGERQIISKSTSKEKKTEEKKSEAKKTSKNLIKEVINDIFTPNNSDDKLMEKYEKYSTEEKEKIEKEAMVLCASSQNISLDFLKTMKKNPLLFSSTLKPFIIQVFKKQLDEAS
ncbi:hypothetical protein [Fusobacterium sp.]|uniref:hypothetical protein n=1 Tax=Fusobacterium sp. TaxID=68766 RepID=UPI002E789ACA|nr:hypothetical protein [Fusobacterium sp.]MEE1475414.1 hypothetical protein [Fusobacterium sp.]